MFQKQLLPDEYIRIVGLKAGSSFSRIWYVTTFDEFKNTIFKYKNSLNLYVTSSTTSGNTGGTKQDMFRRQILFFDFDKKDYPTYHTFDDFVDHFKKAIPDLFYHCAVDSGNGFHFYVAIENTEDIERISNINKKLIVILGADKKAGSITQIMRIPSSLNLKKSDDNLVKVIVNTCGTDKFKPYTLEKLESIIDRIDRNQKFDEEKKNLPKQVYQGILKPFYCVKKMISEGADTGDRNFCLGRITNFYKYNGYTNHRAKELILEWNNRCRPPKSEQEVIKDFERYWETDYKLLGCNIDHKTLEKFCDKSNCTVSYNFSGNTSIIKISNCVLANKFLRKYDGYHYLILLILSQFKDPVSKKIIKDALTDTKTQKTCMCNRTLDKILANLQNGKLICKSAAGYSYSDPPNYGKGYTLFNQKIIDFIVNKEVSQSQFKVFICIVRNLKSGTNTAYETLSENLLMDSSCISKHIKKLNGTLLKIEKKLTDKGYICNAYTIL